MHILVVDDEEAQRTLLAGFLEKKDYTVTTAASGKEAIANKIPSPFSSGNLRFKNAGN